MKVRNVWMRSVLMLSVSALVGLTALPAAQPAGPAASECRGTLVLESFSILQDTDPNPPWAEIDRWTYHVFARQNDGIVARYQDYSIAGESGYFEVVNKTIQQSTLGAAGGPATLKLELWTKEKDPPSAPRGVPPADRGRIVTTRTETCAPAEFHFSVFNDVLARPTPPGPDEHDGRVEFRWKWTLEVV